MYIIIRNMNLEIRRLFDFPYNQLKKNPDIKVFNTKYDGKWVSETITTFVEKFNLLSKALLEIGVQKGDKISITTDRNRTEWHLMDYAIQQVGAVSVPIYPTISDADLRYICKQSEIKYSFVSNEELYKTMLEVKETTPTLQEIYTFDTVSNAKSIHDLLEIGQKSTKEAALEAVKATVQNGDLATIIYTSGTTGNPKGVMLSHQNLISNSLEAVNFVPEGYRVTLSFLPICHVFERMATYCYMHDGVETYFAESIDKLAENAKEVQPHLMTVVPRLLEKIYDKIIVKAQELSLPKRIIFKWALRVANKYEPYTEQNSFYLWRLKVARKLVFSKWQEALGGRIKGLICGSAPMAPNLIRIFMAAGLPILEGYGMTEASPIIAGAKLEKGAYEVGTCGRIMPNMEVKFAEDGEILAKGDNIMMGYYKEPQLTEEAFDSEGFFKTGDIGNLTSLGLLKITDRKKEIFKTSGGKYVAPQMIESLMKTSQFIEQAMVVGAGEKMPCAFILPEFEYIKKWITHKGLNIDITSKKAIVGSKEVIERIQRAIDEINLELGNWEQIKKFVLVPDDWTIESGLVTPTLKLRRKLILEKYRPQYEKMYGRA